jgi:hypothetical protein
MDDKELKDYYMRKFVEAAKKVEELEELVAELRNSNTILVRTIERLLG